MIRHYEGLLNCKIKSNERIEKLETWMLAIVVS